MKQMVVGEDITESALHGIMCHVQRVHVSERKARKTNFQARIRIAMKKYRFFGDQDVYNHLFAEKDEVYVLPCTWNFRTDSRCNIVTGIGILHGNRKLFHRIGSFSSSEHSCFYRHMQ